MRLIDNTKISKFAISVISELQKNDFQAYLVGGCVRDSLAGIEPKDFDIATDATPEQVRKIFKASRIIGRRFKLVHVFNSAELLEVATFRSGNNKTENESNLIKDESGKILRDNVWGTLDQDCYRRDFTINAMAMSITPNDFGDLHDPYNGVKDLMEKHIVTPLDPDQTFSEDPLRMMRAAYFASGLDLEIDDKCLKSMKRQSKRISIVSKERITSEFCKILATKKPSIGLTILQETGLMEFIFPEIHVMYGMDQIGEWHHKDIFYHTMQVVDNSAQLSEKMELRFAALVHDIAKPNTRRIDKNKGYTFHGHDAVGERMLNKVSKRMKLSNHLRDYLKKLTLLHLRPIALAKKEITDSAVRRVMVAAGEDLDDLLTLCRADITTKNPKKVKKYMGNFERVEEKMKDVSEQDKLKFFQSPVRGDEIMKVCGVTEGRIVGQIKVAIEEAILDEKIDNNYESAYKYFLSIKDTYLENSKKNK